MFHAHLSDGWGPPSALHIHAPSVLHCALLLIYYHLLEGNFLSFSVILQFCTKGSRLWIKMRASGYHWEETS